VANSIATWEKSTELMRSEIGDLYEEHTQELAAPQ
jgi:hypothetical protein